MSVRLFHKHARIVLVTRRGPNGSRAWWSPRRLWDEDVDVVGETDVQPGAAQLVWANMMLHAHADPLALMAQWQRALAVDGFLMFSTLGPDTLAELRALYAELGWPAPMAPFTDMHDFGDMLLHAGFADPVMDQETLTLTWPSAQALLDELRALGGNAHPQRCAGLRTPRWRTRLLQALAARESRCRDRRVARRDARDGEVGAGSERLNRGAPR